MKRVICVVEDEKDINNLVAQYLRKEGYEVRSYYTYEQASIHVQDDDVHLWILDIMLDDKSGFDLLEEIRLQGPNIPIIFMSARDKEFDRIIGLEKGCDDYITKPFSMDILILRIRAILRRYHAGESKPETVFDINGRVFDSVHQTFDGKHMSSRESDLLLLLCRNLNQLVERHVILSALWKTEDYFSSRSLSVYVNHLRGFLNETGYRIIGVHGKGYKMVDNK